MLRLLVDTSVWIDTAKGVHGERLIAAVRTLVHQRQVELLVPQVVVEEYDRNREQVVASLAASTRAHVRTVRAALAEHGRSERNDELIEELDEVAVRGSLIDRPPRPTRRAIRLRDPCCSSNAGTRAGHLATFEQGTRRAWSGGVRPNREPHPGVRRVGLAWATGARRLEPQARSLRSGKRAVADSRVIHYSLLYSSQAGSIATSVSNVSGRSAALM